MFAEMTNSEMSAVNFALGFNQLVIQRGQLKGLLTDSTNELCSQRTESWAKFPAAGTLSRYGEAVDDLRALCSVKQLINMAVSDKLKPQQQINQCRSMGVSVTLSKTGCCFYPVHEEILNKSH